MYGTYMHINLAFLPYERRSWSQSGDRPAEYGQQITVRLSLLTLVEGGSASTRIEVRLSFVEMPRNVTGRA